MCKTYVHLLSIFLAQDHEYLHNKTVEKTVDYSFISCLFFSLTSFAHFVKTFVQCMTPYCCFVTT